MIQRYPESFSCYILLTEQISLPDCLYFFRYWEIYMCIATVYQLGCDVINFAINRNFQTKPL